jgi:hypothetical protein
MNTASPTGTIERDEKCTQSLTGIPKGKDTSHVDGRIIIRWTLVAQENRQGLYLSDSE